MKNYSYILWAFLLLFAPVGAHAQWSLKHLDENSGKVGDVKFQNDTLGYFIGGEAYFLKTTDAGENWEKIQIDVDANISAYQLWGDSTIFAVGYSQIIQSRNFGTSWDSVSNLPDKQLLSLWFFNNDSGLVAGYDGIYRTVNQGSSWDTVWSITQSGYKYGDVHQVYFPSGQVGYAIGSGRNQHNDPTFDHFLLKTYDAGSTWEKVNSFHSDLKSLCFTSEHTGFIGAASGVIYKTIDGGAVWTESLALPSGNQVKSIQFINDETGYATGGVTNYVTGGASSYQFFIANTVDEGQTWETYDTTGVPLNAIYFINANTGFVAGDFELIMKSNGVNNKLPDDYPWHLVKTVGMDDNLTNHSVCSVYPNPTSGAMYVKSESPNHKIQNVQLFNVLGQQLAIDNKALHNSIIQLDLSNMAPGNYFLRIFYEDTVETRKIIKQ